MPGTDKKDLTKGAPEDGKKQKEKKPEEVKKVSPVMRFLSSMKFKFTTIIIFYTTLSIVVGCAGALFACLDLYEKTDVLSMKQLVQSIVGGVQISTNVMIQRGGLGAKQIGKAFKNDFSVLSDLDKTEEILAKYVYTTMASTTDASGLFDYKFMPMNLFMMWDSNWTERLVFYRPCLDPKNRRQCELPPRKEAFVDYDNGDFRMAFKDQVPEYFRRIKDLKPTTCPMYGDCVGIADIPNDQGGPMMYFLARVPFHVAVIPEQLRGWHMLWASNMLFFTQIASNRTGLCLSGYSSTEDLPPKVEKEYNKKKEQGQLINPHDSYYNNTNFVATFFQDTDVVTLAQQFYSTTRYEDSDREFCDDSYDHGPAHPRSKSTVYVAYQFFDFVKGKLVDDSYLLRMDYHNPISQRSFTPFHAAIVGTSTAWLVTVCILVIYFNCSFLVPLEKMRRMRSEFIKTSLAGLDDDGTLAKEIFGDMVDDNALIDANGDEIRVMLTLQERLDGFYTGLIKTRSDDLAHSKAYYLRRLNAQRVMNYFMCRESEDLYKSLPGLLDSNEISRHYRRNAANAGDGVFVHDLVNARHTFRQFKAILGNELATEFFKSFCIQRDRSTVNSLFFVMDVSWLNQVEDSSKKGSDDFLSNLFTDSLSQSSNPASVSPQTPGKRPDGLSVSTHSLASVDDSDLNSSRGDLLSPRTHHSHFGRKDTSSSKLAPESEEAGKRIKVPVAGKQSASVSSLPSEAAEAPVQSKQVAAFASSSGDAIAHFIHDRYFGHKSLAKRDMKHSALLGCSRVPDYLALRDGGASVVFSPTMFNNLLTTVVKKFSSDVIPKFLESPSFQVLVYCLSETNYFGKSGKGKHQRAIDDEIIAKKSNALVNGVWQACYVAKKPGDDDSSSDDDTDDEPEEKPEKEEKKDEEESVKPDAENTQ